jgi:hypothetical protein
MTIREKAFFRLEQSEREAANLRSAAEGIVEGLIGEDDVVSQVLGQDGNEGGMVEVAVD